MTDEERLAEARKVVPLGMLANLDDFSPGTIRAIEIKLQQQIVAALAKRDAEIERLRELSNQMEVELHSYANEAAAAIREGRRQMREEAAKVAERIRQCPFEDGKGPKGISENDPCPVCGDLGTFDLEHPSRCLTAAKEIRALPDDPPTQEPPQ